jgi:hypothetical protein
MGGRASDERAMVWNESGDAGAVVEFVCRVVVDVGGSRGRCLR